MADKPSLLKRFQLKEYPQPDIVRLKYPVFMCHGFGALGSVIKAGPMNDPCMELRSHGVVAIAPNIVPYATIEIRAKNWVRLIRNFCKEFNYEKVNVVAHSMGGLDMRYAIDQLGIEDCVSSLTTIASPHYGSSLADLVLKAPELITEKLGDVFDWFGNSMYPYTKSDVMGSVEQLTCSYVSEIFNNEVKNSKQVSYYSYSAAVGKGTEHSLNPVYRFQNAQIYEKEGINDSFVSVNSAKWGKHIETVHLSHLAQMNLQTGKENFKKYQKFWLSVIRNLSEFGH